MNYIVELSKDSHEHELVNSCALYIWQKVFNHDSKFYGSQNHKEALKKFLPSLEVGAFEPVNILLRKRGNKLQWIKIYLHEISSVFNIFRKAKNGNVENIIFLSISPFALFFAKLYLKFISVNFNVIFTLHGDLQYLIQDNLRLSERLLRFVIRLNLSINIKNVYYVVYGHTIKNKLQELVPAIGHQILSLEHPFKSNKNTKFSHSDLYTVGAFGAISKHKNSHKIIELAEIMHLRNPQVQFRLVGKFIDKPIYNEKVVTVIGGEEFLSRVEYEKEISKTSWLIYLYDDRNYELISSGAFLDAVMYCKPIICLKNNFFKHIFQNYEIGIMVDSIEAMPAMVEKLFSKEYLGEFYLKCQNNLNRYALDNKLDNQIEHLRTDIDYLFKTSEL